MHKVKSIREQEKDSVKQEERIYGNVVLHQRRNKSHQRTGPGNQIEYGSIAVSEFLGDSLLPGSAQVLCEETLFLSPLGVPESGEKDWN